MYIKLQGNPPISSGEEDFLRFLAYIAFAAISVI